jgi:hypothetical protein
VLLDLNSGSGAVYGQESPSGAAAVTVRVNAAIAAALLARHRQEAPRDYLGGSRVGEPCARKLVYEITHAPKDRDFDADILRVFDAGHQFEALSIAGCARPASTCATVAPMVARSALLRRAGSCAATLMASSWLVPMSASAGPRFLSTRPWARSPGLIW